MSTKIDEFDQKLCTRHNHIKCTFFLTAPVAADALPQTRVSSSVHSFETILPGAATASDVARQTQASK